MPISRVVVLVVALAAMLPVACGGGEDGAGGGPYASTTAINAFGRADPEQFRPGKLNKDAVAQAKAFSDYPLVWLGEEFEGFKLTSFFRRQGEGYDTTYLIYGDCEHERFMMEPSCVPPLSIVVHAQGTVPGPTSIEFRPGEAIGEARGVTSRFVGGNPLLWTGTIVVKVDANSEHQEKAMQALRTVNHEALGIAEIGPGQSLAALGR